MVLYVLGDVAAAVTSTSPIITWGAGIAASFGIVTAFIVSYRSARRQAIDDATTTYKGLSDARKETISARDDTIKNLQEQLRQAEYRNAWLWNRIQEQDQNGNRRHYGSKPNDK